MRIVFHSLVVASLLVFNGCSSKDESAAPNAIEGECIIAGEEAPAWACGAYEDPQNYVAVGSAPISKLGHNYSRREALANARSSLVHQIEVQVKDKVDSFMRSTGVGDSALGEKVTSQVSQQVSNVTLEGSRQISYWENEGDNSIYLLVAVNKNSVKKQTKEALSSAISTEDALKNQQNAEVALENIFK